MLKAITLLEDDIEEILELIQKIEKKQQLNLTPFKIALYENNKDYKEAFML